MHHHHLTRQAVLGPAPDYHSGAGHVHKTKPSLGTRPRLFCVYCFCPADPGCRAVAHVTQRCMRVLPIRQDTGSDPMSQHWLLYSAGDPTKGPHATCAMSLCPGMNQMSMSGRSTTMLFPVPPGPAGSFLAACLFCSKPPPNVSSTSTGPAHRTTASCQVSRIRGGQIPRGLLRDAEQLT